MKTCKFYLFLVMILLAVPFCLAQSIQADYQIIRGSVLVELNFERVSDFEFRIPYDAEAFEININDYQLEEEEIFVNSAENLEIKYITKTFIDKSGGKYFFILRNNLGGVADVNVYLPEGAVLIENGVLFPSFVQKTTDGQRIILTWNDFNEEQILVEYGFIEDDDWHYLFIICVLIIFIVSGYYINKKRMRAEVEKIKKKKRKKVNKEELTKNLFEDEKKIVEYLLEKKGHESWTKELVRELGISKVKLSRKLRSLEQKEIIKKIPYGNENKIRLL